jgi:hypothetical protein
MNRLAFWLLLVVARIAPGVAIVPHVGCDAANHSCNTSAAKCTDGYNYVVLDGDGNCQKPCNYSMSVCYGLITEVVDNGASNNTNMFGWVSSETGTGKDRWIGYTECIANCTLKTYSVLELQAYQNSGMETYGSSYNPAVPDHTRGRRQGVSSLAIFRTQHQIFNPIDDLTNYNYTPVIVGVSVGVGLVVVAFLALLYYKVAKRRADGATGLYGLLVETRL